jgi:hypothetical protein
MKGYAELIKVKEVRHDSVYGATCLRGREHYRPVVVHMNDVETVKQEQRSVTSTVIAITVAAGALYLDTLLSTFSQLR